MHNILNKVFISYILIVHIKYVRYFRNTHIARPDRPASRTYFATTIFFLSNVQYKMHITREIIVLMSL